MAEGVQMGQSPVTAYFERGEAESFVPNDIAQGGWGPTLGGHVVGGLLAREIELATPDTDLQPARLTVDMLRRVSMDPVRVTASVVRTGRRMQAVDATLHQGGEEVARASALYLRRGTQPADDVWTTPVEMPPVPEDPEQWPESIPMYVRPYGREADPDGKAFAWQHDGRRYAWVQDFRELIRGEELTPFVRAAMAVDVTASLCNFGLSGLAFINADYTMMLSRLPEGPFIGMASLTHYSADGIATATASLFDQRGPIGNGLSTAIANPNFKPADMPTRPRASA
ncbi:thioesterase family protein [soil metagenome]